MPVKIINIVGARPNFMKIAPLMAAYKSWPAASPLLVHTGQHYDAAMSQVFFDELGLPKPDINLGVGSASQTVQTAMIMIEFEKVAVAEKPDLVLVVGDVNSTVACSMVAAKLGIKVAHVEAGLRSFDRTMPEEINRVVTDSLGDLLFCSERSGVDNLRREGVSPEKIFLTGNVMIDTLLAFRDRANSSQVLRTLGVLPLKYALLTLHRPANVDDHIEFEKILRAVDVIQCDMPVIFPIHPRTAGRLALSSLAAMAGKMKNLRMIDPLGYLDFMKLTSDAAIVLTDSGGIQEETAILRVPCLTLRRNTERPSTIAAGGNLLVGSDTDRIVAGYRKLLGAEIQWKTPDMWDGQAAGRIVDILRTKF